MTADSAPKLGSALTALARWYAADTPVIPDPMMQMSASPVSSPSLPSSAKGLASAEELIQKDLVGLDTGSDAGWKLAWSPRIAWCIGMRWRGTESVDIDGVMSKIEVAR